MFEQASPVFALPRRKAHEREAVSGQTGHTECCGHGRRSRYGDHCCTDLTCPTNEFGPRVTDRGGPRVGHQRDVLSCFESCDNRVKATGGRVSVKTHHARCGINVIEEDARPSRVLSGNDGHGTKDILRTVREISQVA